MIQLEERKKKKKIQIYGDKTALNLISHVSSTKIKQRKIITRR